MYSLINQLITTTTTKFTPKSSLCACAGYISYNLTALFSVFETKGGREATEIIHPFCMEADNF